MSHVIAIAVGPVQEFIAAARRTRDLWFGSHLLSEISRAVAKAIEAQGAALIFPASATADNVANVILAELAVGDPKALATQAKQAAQDRWREFADEAFGAAHGVIRPKLPHEEKSIWNHQVEDVIEFYAAWVVRTLDYPTDRAKVMRLLAGRKNCRDFLPAKGRAGVPKSSLDGQRESVLKLPAEWPKRCRARLRIREGEQLDVVGVVKRVAGGTKPYPSVARIAADPWIRGNQTALGLVTTACRDLGTQVIRELNVSECPQFTTFPFDGAAVYVSRHHELGQETEVPMAQLQPLREALARLPQPEPYLAVLVADGDKMGAAISALASSEAHRRFSNTLAEFAGTARRIVNEHNGVLVYAGGDDVLAFLPVDKCLDCARKLHDDFEARLERYGKPTLSVGIALGHFMENLEDLLQYGRDAEKAAKRPDRNGLAIHAHKRGGAPTRARFRWNDNPDRRLTRYAQLILTEAIPGKLPYELRKLADVYTDWHDAKVVAQAIRQDVLRVVRDKQPRAGRKYLAEIEGILQTVTSPGALHRFAAELLVARQIGVALWQAGERSVPVPEVTS